MLFRKFAFSRNSAFCPFSNFFFLLALNIFPYLFYSFIERLELSIHFISWKLFWKFSYCKDTLLKGVPNDCCRCRESNSYITYLITEYISWVIIVAPITTHSLYTFGNDHDSSMKKKLN